MTSGSISWRARADEYRLFAEATKDAQVRDGYLQLARHCESLAEQQKSDEINEASPESADAGQKGTFD